MRHYFQYMLCGIAAALFCIAVFSFLAPLIAALSPMLSARAGGTELTSFSYVLKIILYTIKESFLSVGIAVATGVPAAYFLSHKKLLSCRILSCLSAVPLCIPPLIIALGYIATFGMSGFVNSFFMQVFHLKEPPLGFLYSVWGIAVCQGFYNFPLIMKTVSDSWQALDTSLADCARLLGASRWRIFRTITVYQLLPSVVSSSIPVFLYSFFSFMIVLMFGTVGGTTLEVAVYHAGRSVLNFHSAAVLAFTETCCALFILLSYSFLEQKSSRVYGVSLSNENIKKTGLNLREILPALLFFLTVALFFLMPLFSIALGSFFAGGSKTRVFTLAKWKGLFSSRGFYIALRNTCVTATFSSVLCTVIGFAYAVFFRLNIQKRYSGLAEAVLRTILMLPMAVSSVVMGIGLIMLVRRGSPVHLVLAQTALSWPFAFRQLYAHIKAVPQDVIDAARILSRHRPDMIFSVIIPYCKRSILSVLGFCFAISAGDATLPLVLAVHRFDTLSLYTYRLAGGFRFGEACASGLVLGFLCMGAFHAFRRKQ